MPFETSLLVNRYHLEFSVSHLFDIFLILAYKNLIQYTINKIVKLVMLLFFEKINKKDRLRFPFPNFIYF